jgi:hypothetical protein
MDHPCLEDHDDTQTFIVLLQWQGQFHWYCSLKEDWILDRAAYAKAFGIIEPRCPERYGICVLSESTISAFMAHHQAYALELPTLVEWMRRKFPLRPHEYDSNHFPMLFIDFDARSLYSLFMEYSVFERYVPEGWKGDTCDFSGLVPAEQRYWVQEGIDYWKVMVEIGNRNTLEE